ncbi:MAG: PAS domain S-box protein [Actinobacteria bacterium]|nr:PAS domain S-box protein [Actinomycetota bacterium]
MTRSGELAAGLVDVVYALRLEPDMSFEYVSPSVEALVGYTPAEHYADPQLGMKLLDPRDIDILLGAAQAEVDEVVDMTVRWLAKNGRVIWTHHRCIKQRRDDGSVVLYGAARDVTEQHEMNARYRLLAENGTDAVASGDNAGHVVWVSDSVAGLLGWSPQEVVGKAFADFVHPQDRDSVFPVQRDVLRGEPGKFEVRLRTSDGTYRWVNALVKPVLDDEGSVDGWIAGWRDAEAEHVAREALAASEERYRLLAENASDIVVQVNLDGTLEWVSPSVKAILGWDPDALRGTRPWDIVHPDDREAAAESLASAQHEHEDPARMSLRFAKSDGTFLWMAAAAHHATEKQIVVSFRDVDDQVHAEAARAIVEERYRLLADNASDVVYLTGPDRLISWISPAVTASLGWAPTELIGTPMYDLVHPEDRVRMDAMREAVFAGTDIENPKGGWPSRFRHKDGTYTWMSMKTTVIHAADGGMVAAVSGLRDVDDLVREREHAQNEAARRTAIVASLLDPHVLLTAVRDESGSIVDFTYLDANVAACEYNKMSREDLVGSRLLDLLPGHEAAGLLSLYSAAIDSGEPLVLDDFAYPNEIHQGERYYDIRAVRVGDSLSYTWRDVTDRHQAARIVAESEERYRLLAQNSSDVVVRSRAGLMLWVSPSLARVLGWSPDAWIGHDLFEYLNKDDRARVTEASSRVAQGEVVYARYRVRDDRGAYHWVDASSSRYIDQSGRVDGVVSSFRLADDAVGVEMELERRATFDDLTGALKRDPALDRL